MWVWQALKQGIAKTLTEILSPHIFIITITQDLNSLMQILRFDRINLYKQNRPSDEVEVNAALLILCHCFGALIKYTMIAALNRPFAIKQVVNFYHMNDSGYDALPSARVEISACLFLLIYSIIASVYILIIV